MINTFVQTEKEIKRQKIDFADILVCTILMTFNNFKILRDVTRTLNGYIYSRVENYIAIPLADESDIKGTFSPDF
jgi:hypothetical protein